MPPSTPPWWSPARSAAARRHRSTTDPLLLSIERTSRSGNNKNAAAEILVATEPEIVNTATLPDPISSYAETGDAVPDAKSGKRTVGGTSFTNAPLLGPGSYTDGPAVGENVFYKVRLGTGQRLRTTVVAPSSKDAWKLSQFDTVTVATVLYTPSRVPQTKQSAVLQGDNRRKVTASTPQVRVRNREIAHETAVTTEGDARTNASYASVAGEYYVSVEVRSEADLAGQVLPIRVNLAVDGKPAGQPEYATAVEATPSPSASASTGASPSTGASSEPPASAPPNIPPTAGGPGLGALGVAAAAGAAVAALAGLGVALAVRRSRASRTTPGREG